MSSKAGKRPLRALSAHEKLEAIRRVHDGESKASVARDIGVPESTLRGWCKNEDKISYLSRQSSPETDESSVPGAAEPKEKRAKLEDALQPYNLSKKSNGGAHSPGPNDFDAGKPLNLNVKTSPMSERERNRAELERLKSEFGLNQPEMTYSPYMTGGNNFSDITSGLLAQWKLLIVRQNAQNAQNNTKITAPADTSTMGIYPPRPEERKKSSKPPKVEKPTSEDPLLHYLKTQHPMLGLMQQNQNVLPPTTAVSSTSNTPNVTSSSNSYNDTPMDLHNSSWFWKWYKQIATSAYPHQQQTPDKPILYQQLTKDKDSYSNTENIIVEEKPAAKNNSKARAALDNLLCNNNNNNLTVGKKDVREDLLSQYEAVEHGEKLLQWLECCSEPSVTTLQIMQFKTMLQNIKSGAERKSGDLQNRAKVKRK